MYRSYRYTVHTSITFIPVYRSTGIPFPSARYTVHIGIPFASVYLSHRYTVHIGLSFTPVYRSNHCIININDGVPCVRRIFFSICTEYSNIFKSKFVRIEMIVMPILIYLGKLFSSLLYIFILMRCFPSVLIFPMSQRKVATKKTHQPHF